MPHLPGSAASKALRRLRKAGAHPIRDPHTFDVLGMTGPLAEGELDAVRQWGAELGETVRGGATSVALPRTGTGTYGPVPASPER